MKSRRAWLASALSVVVRTGSVMGTQPKNLPVGR
nr:MAG TPA: hypothetical protein [Bacteriophage sp.]